MSAHQLLLIPLLVVAASISHSVDLLSQAPAPSAQAPRMLHVNQVRLKPGMIRDYVALQTGEVMPALQKAGVKMRDAYQTMFGAGGEFVFVTEITDMAQFDGQPPLRKALGDEAFFALGAKLGQLVAETNSRVIRTRPDLSYAGQQSFEQAAVVVMRIEVVPGRSRELEGFLRNEIVPVMQKGQVPAYWVSETVFGGAATEYHTLTHFESFAALGKGNPVVRILGEDGLQALLSKLAGIVHRADRFVMRYRADLSWPGAGGAPAE